MSGIGVTIDQPSLRRFQQNLRRVAKEAHARGTQEVKKFLVEASADAQTACPVDTGALKSSHRTAIEVKEDKITAALGYGSNIINPKTFKPTFLYAGEAHEWMGGKWLERAMYRQKEEFRRALEEAFTSLFGGV